MKLRAAEITGFVLVCAAFVTGVLVYPHLPIFVASHWNAAGDVDGTTTQFWGAFLLPIILVPMWLLFLLVPRIDPKKENIAQFRAVYDMTVLLIMLFMLYLYGLTLAFNLGNRFDFLTWLVPAFGVLFIGLGKAIGHAQPNWFMGIRTPWTMSNDVVWHKTHALGSRLFVAAGVLAMLGVFFPRLAIWFVLVPVVAAALTSVVASYYFFRHEERLQKLI